jgi:membrane-bound serine protease (ClpP class)
MQMPRIQPEPRNDLQRGGYAPVLAGLALLLSGAGAALYVTGGPSWFWIGAALLCGIGLLALEAFVIPGFGPVGVAAILLTTLGLLAALVPDGRAAPFVARPLLAGLTAGHLVAAAGVAAGIAGGVLLSIHAPRLPVLSGLTLPTPDGAALSLPHPHPDVAHVGDVGEVTADLRPGGRARFGVELVDVRSRGEYVSAGVRVEVLRREGAAIIVRPLQGSTGSDGNDRS